MFGQVICFKKASLINLESTPSTICDVIDGSLYRSFLSTHDGKTIINGHGITLSLNTDGCNPSDIPSAASLWPIFLSINENTVILHFYSKILILKQ